MPSVPVLVFNTSALSVTVSVNNGPQFTIAGAYPPNFVPQTPQGGGPGWNNQQPAPGTFAPGNNYVTTVTAGSGQVHNLMINLSRNIQWQSLELYLFFSGNGQPGWLALNNGFFVAGNMP